MPCMPRTKSRSSINDETTCGRRAFFKTLRSLLQRSEVKSTVLWTVGYSQRKKHKNKQAGRAPQTWSPHLFNLAVPMRWRLPSRRARRPRVRPRHAPTRMPRRPRRPRLLYHGRQHGIPRRSACGALQGAWVARPFGALNKVERPCRESI